MIPNLQILFEFCYPTPELTLGSALIFHNQEVNPISLTSVFILLFKLQNPHLALKQTKESN